MRLSLFLLFLPGAAFGQIFAKPINSPPVIASVTHSSRTVTGTTINIFPANANRKAIECWTLCSNTADIFLAWGRAALTTDEPHETCSYWSPPAVIISTMSLNAISSGSQVIRCREYY